ncbi:hypothetical protein SGQ83_03625 [Flavobacterium sp. Fl-318]|uniref:Uncharacterized protein n=1 Tax=Flavobacterium cupriresistens TaxID=2893885 RepID=A0ABU4R9A4_9FLAO|nr:MULTISPECIES: hypothetical protein [unclassified Flavobacterium]MDX6188428.1 hypothetical protein [Flavobacterium sp. Fl-318]UFH44901.1 hypothetical protein LNP23_12025 [Flavobacterium sp. F-323]
METYTIDTLNQRIRLLENRQDREWCAIKEEIDEIRDNLKPLNLIRNTVEEINETVGFKSNLAQSAVSIVIGYLAKKIVVGKSDSKIKNIFGTLLQFAVTNIVSKPHESSKE